MTAPDGTTPIVIALPSDPTSSLLAELAAVGGAANVVMAIANGALIFGIRLADESDVDEDIPALTAGCTVGVFLQRVIADGGNGRYRFKGLHDDRESGRAELLGVAS